MNSTACFRSLTTPGWKCGPKSELWGTNWLDGSCRTLRLSDREAPATWRAREGGLAVLEEPRVASSPSVWMRIPNEPLRHHFVEIRDASRGHALVTLIEIASPTNKRPGPDRRAYEAKRQEILDSDTSLIELDLLRGGQPLIGRPLVIEAAAGLEPRPDYLVAVNRAWQRGAELQYQLFPIRLEEPLPCILVPLREGEAEPPLDLQYVFRQAYDRGPYARGAVDYDGPPDPPVRPDLAEWMKVRLKSRS